ncbi:MAG: hypothetical protein KGD67_02785 [Candidatus Lokiarchaeota archaeon]|nr:hypothetical protein [Candidatus Lokiarchaeota archaeon]
MAIENVMLVLSTCITGTLVAIGGMITFVYAFRRKNRLFFLFSAMWLMYAVFWFIDAAAHFFYSIPLMALAIVPQLIGVPCIIIFIELSGKEYVNPIKISVLMVLEALVFIITFYVPENWEIIPGYGIHNKGVLRFAQVIYIFYFMIFYFLWSFHTWRKAPANLKRLTSYLLFGSTTFSIVTGVLYVIGTFIRTFNAIGFFINGIGAFITILVILKDPRIIYILPFKAYRILVVDTKTSVSLFKYDWAKAGEVEENIFTMMIQAIGSVLDDILKKGDVQEIQMDRAVILINHNNDNSIASVLIASKSSKSLRYGLKRFNAEFRTHFQRTFDNSREVGDTNKILKIVEQVFDFVPSYKSEID